MADRRALVAGNWKMNGLSDSGAELDRLIGGITEAEPRCEVMICPPATLIMGFAATAAETPLAIGAQDCHWEDSGAHTGDISAKMLRDAGATAVIVGHSERRTDHGELDFVVRRKAEAAYRAGLTAIICVGETQKEREAGKALDVIATQLRGSVPESARARNTVIAYEPVWAIGTGLTPTPEDVAEAHGFIRQRLSERLGPHEGASMRILYGGSVKPDNAAELMGVDDVDGALVGGASLKARDFLGILAVYR